MRGGQEVVGSNLASPTTFPLVERGFERSSLRRPCVRNACMEIDSSVNLRHERARGHIRDRVGSDGKHRYAVGFELDPDPWL
jgi:hypothetical protein